MGVNEGSEVYSGKKKKNGRYIEGGEEGCGFQPRSLWSVSLRGEMRLGDGSVRKVSSLLKRVMIEKAKSLHQLY